TTNYSGDFAFVSKINSSGTSYVYSNRFGGGKESITGIALDGRGGVYIGGEGPSAPPGVDLLPGPPGYASDVWVFYVSPFLARISDEALPVALAANTSNLTAGQTVTLTAQLAGVGSVGTVQFFDGAALIGSSAVTNNSAVVVASPVLGIHTFTARYQG